MRSGLSRAAVSFLIVMLMIPAVANAQAGPATAAMPPISQPLMREGDFASDLARALTIGPARNETEAESSLSAVGVMPRNGWIADYPVTPDIMGEIETSISEAADSGKLPLGKDAAVAAFQGVINSYNMSVSMDQGQAPAEAPSTNYPVPSDLNDYYLSEGPPVVTYYEPPPDYAYLYTWVPYPFWWSDYWFPGFFVLVDFGVSVNWHGHKRFCTNHYRNPETGSVSRIDPTNRYRGGIFPETATNVRTNPSAQKGAQAIANNSEAYRQSRGYGVARASAATRSSAFDRSSSITFERAASDRGYQSRSKAHQIPAPGSAGRGVSHGGGGGGGYHGGGHSR